MALDFAGRAAAKAWQDKAQELTDQANSIMNGVQAALDEINTASRGGMVDELMITGSQMVEATSKMVSGFAQLVTVVDTIIGILEAALQAAVETVTGCRNQMTR